MVESVYCAVRTDSLNKADYVSSLKRLIINCHFNLLIAYSAKNFILKIRSFIVNNLFAATTGFGDFHMSRMQ